MHSLYSIENIFSGTSSEGDLDEDTSLEDGGEYNPDEDEEDETNEEDGAV